MDTPGVRDKRNPLYQYGRTLKHLPYPETTCVRIQKSEQIYICLCLSDTFLLKVSMQLQLKMNQIIKSNQNAHIYALK